MPVQLSDHEHYSVLSDSNNSPRDAAASGVESHDSTDARGDHAVTCDDRFAVPGVRGLAA